MVTPDEVSLAYLIFVMSGLVPELALVSSAAASWPTWWQVVSELALFLAVASVIGGALTYIAVVRPVLRATEGAETFEDVLA